jgi:hypothetical protein
LSMPGSRQKGFVKLTKINGYGTVANVRILCRHASR